MALSADTSRKFGISEGPHSYHPVKASSTIYEGAAVGSSSGLARPLNAGDSFLGFAFAKADNGSGSNSTIDCELRTKGEVTLSVTSVASAGDIGSTVYASDDTTFTLTSSGNRAIGKIIRWVTGTTCVVYYEAVTIRSI